MFFVCPPKILHKQCLYFLLGLTMISKETGNNVYAKFWMDKQRVLWYFLSVANWGHHLYHSKVDGGVSHDRQIHTQTRKSPRANGLSCFSEKTRKSDHLQMLEQRQHLLLNYFKTPRASCKADWHLTNYAHQATVDVSP